MNKNEVLNLILVGEIEQDTDVEVVNDLEDIVLQVNSLCLDPMLNQIEENDRVGIDYELAIKQFLEDLSVKDIRTIIPLLKTEKLVSFHALLVHYIIENGDARDICLALAVEGLVGYHSDLVEALITDKDPAEDIYFALRMPWLRHFYNELILALIDTEDIDELSRAVKIEDLTKKQKSAIRVKIDELNLGKNNVEEFVSSENVGGASERSHQRNWFKKILNWLKKRGNRPDFFFD